MNFQQRVIAGSMGPINPHLFWHLFDPEHVPAEYVDDNDVVFPTTEDEFEQMVAEWEAADAAQQHTADTHRP